MRTTHTNVIGPDERGAQPRKRDLVGPDKCTSGSCRKISNPGLIVGRDLLQMVDYQYLDGDFAALESEPELLL